MEMVVTEREVRIQTYVLPVKNKTLLSKPSLKEVYEYIDWVRHSPVVFLAHLPIERIQAFPEFLIESIKAHYWDGIIDIWVSPTHHWFFKNVYKNQFTVSRPRTNLKPEDFFIHPIIRADFLEAATLVVPEYFLREDSEFAGLEDLGSTGYYVFPNFAVLLFKYAKRMNEEGNETTSFIDFLIQEEQGPLIFPRGCGREFRHLEGHSLLGEYWRWTEVLQMLWFWKDKPETGLDRPLGSILAPGYDWTDNLEISNYLDNFGKVAKVWLPTVLEEEAKVVTLTKSLV